MIEPCKYLKVIDFRLGRAIIECSYNSDESLYVEKVPCHIPNCPTDCMRDEYGYPICIFERPNKPQ